MVILSYPWVLAPALGVLGGGRGGPALGTSKGKLAADAFDLKWLRVPRRPHLLSSSTCANSQLSRSRRSCACALAAAVFESAVTRVQRWREAATQKATSGLVEVC
jgi:hypothetical protein